MWNFVSVPKLFMYFVRRFSGDCHERMLFTRMSYISVVDIVRGVGFTIVIVVFTFIAVFCCFRHFDVVQVFSVLVVPFLAFLAVAVPVVDVALVTFRTNALSVLSVVIRFVTVDFLLLLMFSFHFLFLIFVLSL